MKFISLVYFFALISSSSSFALDIDAFEKLEEKQNEILNKFGADPKKVEEIADFVQKNLDERDKLKRRRDVEFLYEEQASLETKGCLHCPKHLQLANSMNQILDEMKKNPELSDDQEIPVSINRLKFLFYTVKSRSDDGSIRCDRFMDFTPDGKPTKLDGDMELMAQDVFRFDGITQLQVLDPKKEEVVYYYRGEGSQKNIIVQAFLNKEGGRLRYYYYRPTKEESNPYNLPSLGEEDLDDVTLKKDLDKKDTDSKTSTDLASEDKENKYELKFKPKIETKLKVIPKNIHLAEGEVIHEFEGSGLKINAKSALSLRENKAQVNVMNEEGKSYVLVDLNTNIRGETKRKITIPYEIRLGLNQEKGLAASGKIEDKNTEQLVTLSLTDSVTQYFRTEYKKNKTDSTSQYSVSKDFSMGQSEILTFGVGKNSEKNKYATIQHRKAIKDNLTMVLDVRVDENRKASFTYQLKAKF